MITFKQSGHSGDLIYSLASVKYLCEKLNVQCIFYVGINVEADFTGHSMGKYMISPKVYDMLYPLLMAQDYIAEVKPYVNEKIDYDLDQFRKENINTAAFNIALWHSYVYTELTPDLSQPWIKVKPREIDLPIVNRTLRYTNGLINYNIFKEAYFIGVDMEWRMVNSMLNANYKRIVVNDFLEMAECIAGTPMFLGNQSMAFALAEAMKVPRALESFQQCPNVIPQGGQWAVFRNQNELNRLT
jgi:hypothetical protein